MYSTPIRSIRSTKMPRGMALRSMNRTGIPSPAFSVHFMISWSEEVANPTEI